MAADSAILVINSRSSSVKFALFGTASIEPQRTWSGSLERIGFDDGRFLVGTVDGTALADETREIPDHDTALDAERNAGQQRVVSTDGSTIPIEAFKTDEELVIARHTQRSLSASENENVRAHG
tara:strand:+ start:1402 stop:1773 length:372 start_codon:yes stop_codon:yes gene_type:complete